MANVGDWKELQLQFRSTRPHTAPVHPRTQRTRVSPTFHIPIHVSARTLIFQYRSTIRRKRRTPLCGLSKLSRASKSSVFSLRTAHVTNTELEAARKNSNKVFLQTLESHRRSPIPRPVPPPPAQLRELSEIVATLETKLQLLRCVTAIVYFCIKLFLPAGSSCCFKRATRVATEPKHCFDEDSSRILAEAISSHADTDRGVSRILWTPALLALMVPSAPPSMSVTLLHLLRARRKTREGPLVLASSPLAVAPMGHYRNYIALALRRAGSGCGTPRVGGREVGKGTGIEGGSVRGIENAEELTQDWWWGMGIVVKVFGIRKTNTIAGSTQTLRSSCLYSEPMTSTGGHHQTPWLMHTSCLRLSANQ
ncbi:hypothetical protein M427DRAFT_497526 [Gonapodya prolifera JEL478]|uniref:Uncharacterized protein n=1 Tax=Gonapodya prolifera (strain JEL478) TaxID=1344416 RepID=A0A139AFW0_GONPJ|nr:hypothetical protein M427DRAFT_497526 [Gonapodya prolifera JEL478]|eukprot:KXS15303.1 hypothetical protein M427DRAFT_497526 [Gonapodya prolifera JEL478]